MSKTKMRCITCGKWFQSANAKEVTCPDCTQKARKEKMAAKASPPSLNKTTEQSQGTGSPTRPTAPAPPPKPKPASGGTSHWLDTLNDVKVGQPDQPPRPKLPSSPAPRAKRGGDEPDRGGNRGPANYRDRDERGPAGNREGGKGPGNYREGGYRGPANYRENDYRGPGPYRAGGGIGIPDTAGQRPRQPMESDPNRVPRPAGPGEPRPDKFRPGGKKDGKPAGQKPKPKPTAPPKPKREKIPPPAPFTPTPEQVAQVEARYVELAVPTEFDGIRTQISQELTIPKTAVKKIIKEFRERLEIPSWWDLQTYNGSSEDLERIKTLYVPLLPLPPVGIHKNIAEELSLKPGLVYQAIKTIRQEMNLPQYNDPALHGLELSPTRKKAETQPEPAPVNQETESQPEPTSVKQETETHVEEKIEPQGEISSLETDMTIHKLSNTTEGVTVGTTEENHASEA